MMNRFILSPNHQLAGIRDNNLKQLKRVRVKIRAEKAVQEKLAKTQMLKACPIHQEKVRLKNEKAKATREAKKLEREEKIKEQERLKDEADLIEKTEDERERLERKQNPQMFVSHY